MNKAIMFLLLVSILLGSCGGSSNNNNSKYTDETTNERATSGSAVDADRSANTANNINRKLVGTWRYKSSPTETEVLHFSSDGSYSISSDTGPTASGIWEATGSTLCTVVIHRGDRSPIACYPYSIQGSCLILDGTRFCK